MWWCHRALQWSWQQPEQPCQTWRHKRRLLLLLLQRM